MSVRELADTHMGGVAYVVGRGPSLVNVTSDHIGEGPVLTLNHAIEFVRTLSLSNPIYSMQKDGVKVTPQSPERLIVSSVESVNDALDYSPRYVMDVREDFGLRWDEWSLPCAVSLAYLMGCRHVVLLAFDGVTDGDSRLWTAGEIKPTPDHHLFYYRRAGKIARSIAQQNNMVLSWVTPLE